MSYTNNNYLITTTILITLYHLLNIPPIAAFSSEDDTEIGYKCLPRASNKDFTDSYRESRALVVIDVIYSTASNQGFRMASHTWFRNASDNRTDPEEWSYGLAQCRGDLSPGNCTACVINATNTLINTTDHCPHSRSAIIFLDYCLFKYSDVDFFTELDTANNFPSTSGSPIGYSPDQISDLMNNLRNTAIASHMLYAVEAQTALYGMVQCTRDLSKNNCTACLDSAITQLFNRLWFDDGARVVYGSCFVRYETYNFIHS